MSLDWRRLSAAEREQEYSPSSCIGGNYRPYIRTYAERSDAARRAHPPETLRYGPGDRQTIDLFLPDGVAEPPLLVFFHGGYWQELSKQESAFAAPGCLALGIAYAAVDYTLAPAAALSEIVAECRAAMASLVRFRRRVVAGSSAGAHLAAMAASGANGAVLISGIYDLEPLIGTSIDTALGLDASQARANSPLYRPLRDFPPSLVGWGDNETDQFKRQSRVFVQALRSAGGTADALECAGRNHFDVILDLADPDTELGRRTLALLRAFGDNAVG
ncbi:MAG TPA: alpha/beta hydrolase [Reyranella sp.]|nr:alpha/beta hydrolase [Reyranella sp.]